MNRLVFLGAAVMVAWPSPVPAQSADSVPPDVTPLRIEAGRTLYHGPGLCVACHGPGGAGVEGVGPALGDTIWLHSDGSYAAIAAQIRSGVTSAQSKSGIMMPPRGGASLNDEQIRAVAAYVWSLRRRTN